jgi:zinc transporter ZupT
MPIRLLLVLTAVGAGIATYFVGRMRGIDERWPDFAAAFAVGTMLAFFLHLIVGGSRKAGTS